MTAYCPPGGSVLDLGAGTGRVADPLARRGFAVTAVDDSVEMLSHVAHARTVCKRIEDLDLGDSFDVVLLASHLVNTSDSGLRDSLLSAATRHVGAAGHVLIQRHPPSWFDSLEPGAVRSGSLGDVEIEMTVSALSHGELTASVRYRVDRHTWTQDFSASRLDGPALDAALARCGLRPAAPVSVDGQTYNDWVASAQTT